MTVNNYLAGKPDDTVDAKISFKNVHYFAAGATLFGDAAQGAYQYDGQTYAGQNTVHPLNKCTDCHEVHALTVKVEACKGCHTNVTSAGDLEKIRATTDTDRLEWQRRCYGRRLREIDGFRQALFAAIQAYAEKSGTPIVYDAASYPYFFVDADKDGKPDTTASGGLLATMPGLPSLMKAAYNYQYSIKDPGAFAHNPTVRDAVPVRLDKDLGGDVSKFTRP